MASMEHEPWIGPDYESQPQDRKLLIVGFSHWGRYAPESEPEKDDDADFTRNVFRRWVFDETPRFFAAIPQYFGEEHATFWNRVTFANTLPTSVGDGDNRYHIGTPEQRAAAESRALSLVERLRPARVFVFSTKAWRLWPDFTGSLKDGTLRVDGHEIDAGTYRHADGEALAFGLRHTQGANTDRMRALVAAAMRANAEDLRQPD